MQLRNKCVCARGKGNGGGRLLIMSQEYDAM